MPPDIDPSQKRRTSPFRLELTAATADVDALGHVSNIAYVRWIQRVAEAHSAARGYDWPAYRRLGAVFVVRRHEIDYLRSAYAGDRVLLSTWVESWRMASCVRRTEVVRSGDGAALVRAATRWALVSFASGKPRRIPDALRDEFSAD